jgi:hypothetical protein
MNFDIQPGRYETEHAFARRIVAKFDASYADAHAYARRVYLLAETQAATDVQDLKRIIERLIVGD